VALDDDDEEDGTWAVVVVVAVVVAVVFAAAVARINATITIRFKVAILLVSPPTEY
jgi:hypothetical protein